MKRTLVILSIVLGAALRAAPSGALETPNVKVLEPSGSRATIDLAAPAADDDRLRQLSIEAGKSVFVRTGYRVKRVSVGNPDILDVVVISPRELQFVARKVGTTNLLIWDEGGRPQGAIDVHVGAPHSRMESELRRILGSDDIHVESAGNGVVLKGSLPSAVALEQAMAVAKAVLEEDGREAKQVVNLLEVRGQHQVMLEVVVAEMSRSVRRQFGTNVNGLISTSKGDVRFFSFLQGLTSLDEAGDVELSQAVNLFAQLTGFGDLQALQVFLDLLDERGLSKVLAEPTLVARSGETASFLVGGEVPIPVAQGGAFGSITVEFKSFGVGVAFTPTVLSPDRIHLEVLPEVSDVDFSVGTEVEGTVVPGFTTRRAATAVELADGESFAIAGLLREDVVALKGQYPWLGQIPVLGALFRSSQFEKQETELVIIVTPRLVQPLGPGPHPLPTDHYIEPSELEFYLLGALEGRPDEAERAAAGGMIGGSGHVVDTLPEEDD